MRTKSAITACVLCAVALLPLPAGAQDDAPRRYGKFYNGAFVDVAARAARTHVTSSDYNGWSWDVGLRQAFVMHLLDTRVSYGEDHWQQRDGGAGRVVARSLNVHGAFHPAYMALLLSDWLGYLVASFYVEAGLGAQHAVSSGESDLGMRFSIGAGFDVPLMDPDRGWSVWVNALYRYTWSDFDFDSGAEIDLYHHAGWLGLSLRFNGLLF